MKTEFLQNFQVDGKPLTKEIIDAIMAENGRDIEAAKRPFADYDTIKQQLATAQETIKSFESQDIEGVRQSARDWEKKYNDAIADHQKKMADRDFNDALSEAIRAARGRSVKAILGELGTEKVDALKASKNQTVDIKAALDALQKDSGYLFGDDQGAPPPYAGGTGTQSQNIGAGDFNFGFTGVRAKPAGN